MQHRGDELHLLLHSLRQFLDLAVPPAVNLKLLEPPLQPPCGLVAAQTLELRQIDGLLAHLHFLVKAALFGHIAELVDVVGSDGVAVERHRTAVGRRNLIDDSDERCLACAVGPQQPEHRTLRHLQAHAVERRMVAVPLADFVGFEDVHIVIN